MAKTVRRFHANFLRITMDYGGKEQKVSKKQNQHRQQVPPMPKMKFNPDSSPCFKHLTEDKETQKVHRKNISKDQQKVPEPPKMRWNKDGSMDWSHL